MNQTLELIANRRSVRVYSSVPVTEEDKLCILQAAMRAPTAGNMMLYSILEIEKQELKDQLAISCDNQPFIARAPYLLLFLADYQRWMDYYDYCQAEEHAIKMGLRGRKPGMGDLMLACCDALIAAQTAVLAAESLGFGSCYIGDIMENYEVHQKLFDLPRYTFPIALVCFGRPRHELSGKRTTRFNNKNIVRKDGYHRLSASELEDFPRPILEADFPNGQFMKGAENFGQHNYMRKFIADFSFEMNRSVKKMMEVWEDG